jgi:predicted HAD superfamily Cof-like phosphohydrolase
LNREQKAVRTFHALIGTVTPDHPMIPPIERQELRINLIEEELEELEEAFAAYDLVAIADALGDLQVVVYGCGLECGIDMEPVFKEVHRSNMTKKGGAKRADGKVLKPIGYSAPDLRPILTRQLGLAARFAGGQV